MKTGQLTLFTDIINEAVKDDLESKGQVLPPEHWINQSLKSEDDKTLLLASIELNQYDFMENLLRSGADPNLYRQVKIAPKWSLHPWSGSHSGLS